MGRRIVPRGLLLFATLCVLAATASAASATTYYASPSGTATSNCTTPQNPCDLPDAIGTAPQANGDEVIVEPGTYTVSPTTGMTASKAVDIHGAAGEPMPVIDGTTASGYTLLTLNGGTGTVLRDLELNQEQTSGPPSGVFDQAGGAIIDDVIAQAPGSGVTLGAGTVLRDSVVRSTAVGERAVGVVSAGTARVENVTAYAAGYALGAVNFIGTGSAVIIAENVIAHGGQGDLEASAPTSGSAILQVGYSNYSFSNSKAAGTGASIDTSEGHNQNADTQPPLLVNPSGGDFREQSNSPTVDAGIDDSSLGSTDPDGHPRVLGAAPDIGAYELPVPLALTGGSTGVSGSGATLTGSVDPEAGSLTSCTFQYGTSTSYGHSAPCVPASATGNQPVAVTANLSGLSPGTTYHYRLIATNTSGTDDGVDETLTTLVPPSPASPPTLQGTPAAGVTLTCRPGTWRGRAPLTFRYSWLRDGRSIGGQRSSSYRLRAADVGHALQCQVTATNPDGSALADSGAVVVRAGVEILPHTATVKGGTAPISLACIGGSGQCTGTLTLSHGTSVFGRARFSILAGKQASIPVPLNHAAVNALSSARHHRLSVLARAGQASATITLKG